ncbi:MAG: diguanylate cyclase [Lachnospiraceae bacterium]|nr:diguanylate cyclase [Lachnospiraceae bacterium]
MRRKTDNVNLIEWWISAAVMLIAVFSLLIWFATNGEKQEEAEVEALLIQQMKQTALKVEKELCSFKTCTETLAASFSQIEADEETVLKMAMAAGRMLGMYDVILCEEDGTGYRLQGGAVETVTVSEDIYLMSTYTDKDNIMFAAQDDLHDKASIIIVEPVGYEDRKTQYLICYFGLPDLQWLITDRIFGSDVFYVVLDGTGASIQAVQNSNSWQNPMCKLSEDYISFLEEVSGDTAAVDKLHAGVSERYGGISYLRNPGNNRYFVYAPMDFMNFTLVTAIGTDYVDRMISEEWKIGNTLVTGLGIAFAIFMLVLIVIMVVNLIKNSNKRKDLEEKADTDLLTELYNKISTERKIKECMIDHPNEQGLLFILDIDNFKKINDTMGHAFGDEVLRTLGTSIRSEFRATDILGRTGGDEFTLFLRNLKDDDIIKMEAEKVEQFFKNFKAGTYTKYSVTASIGAAVFPRDGANFEDLYKAADNALYVAKKRGKNQLAFYGDKA